MKTMLIINPRSGRCKPSVIKSWFINNRILKPDHIFITQYRCHATELASKAVDENYESIVVAGGDGTINEVLQAVIGTKIKIAIVPTGSANDLARQNRIPSNWYKNIKKLNKENIRKLDVIQINNHYCLTFCGFGLPFYTAYYAQLFKEHFLRHIINSSSIYYVLGLIYSVITNYKASNQITYISNGTRSVQKTSAMLIGNQPMIGKYFHIFSDAINDDSLADILIIRHQNSLIRLTKVIHSLLRRSLNSNKELIRIITGECEVILNKAEKILADGEYIGNHSKLFIKVLPKAFNLIIPAKEIV